MKFIKYKTSSNDYCIVYKTKIIICFFLYKNNEYHYYESGSIKNYNKTKKITEKLLKQKIIDVKSENYDQFKLLALASDYISKVNNDYHLITDTFSNEKYVTFCILKDQKIFKEFKGQRYSPTFIFSCILYKFGFNFGTHFHGFIEPIIQDIEEKDKKRLKKFSGLMFYKYLKYDFKDINVNFDLFLYSLDQKFLIRIFQYYDKIININTDKIIKHFNLYNKEKKLSYLYYGLTYFSSLFFIDVIKKSGIKNSNISINSCLFNIDISKSFFDNDNNYFFSPLNNLKNGCVFFIDSKYNEYIKLIKNKYSKKINKKVKELYLN